MSGCLARHPEAGTQCWKDKGHEDCHNSNGLRWENVILLKPEGQKRDAGKARWDLLPYRVLGEVVDVLNYGVAKYAAWQWRDVPNARERYFAAAQRHLTAWWRGEFKDEESGLPHLAHALCCLLFLRALEIGDVGAKAE